MTVAPPGIDTRRAIEVPAAPPTPRRKRRDPLWAQLTVIVGVLLMLGSVAGVLGTKYVINTATSAVTQDNLLGDTKKSVQDGGGDNLKGPIDLLLLGVDARKRWAVDDLRSDTIIALHIPAGH
ncbi:MAG: hypothetical protein QOH97_594, partial [Actinoplanes sp.]|nr:hypothetical protein [Actinoplanes sp.]